MSFQHSSRILEPLLRWLFPHLSRETVGLVVFLARKCAHLSEYAVLALLLWRALNRPAWKDPRPWSWSQARLTVLCVMLYAASDEFHQLFVVSREARVEDVMIDTTGGALGLLALWALGRWLRRW